MTVTAMHYNQKSLNKYQRIDGAEAIRQRGASPRCVRQRHVLVTGKCGSGRGGRQQCTRVTRPPNS
ncbi:hypothetical protein J6590_069577 [Homalodisca vitripennis]|nr:hypothetical protein J6590_069577 [Homalodisca vitripennis]